MRLVRSINRPPEGRDAVHPTANRPHIWISPKRGLVMNTPLPQDTRHPENAKPFPVLRQYAALPWRMNRDGLLEVLLATSRRRGLWTVPKRWQVNHRPASQFAEAEAFEEAGVIGQVRSEPTGSDLYSKRRDDSFFESRNATIFRLHVQGSGLQFSVPSFPQETNLEGFVRSAGAMRLPDSSAGRTSLQACAAGSGG